MAATQDALYREIDLDLSWSESELPERERTKHVHRLHPYLGKFIPQLVEALLERYLPPDGRVLDPFAGSGTTLVQALESGLSAAGADIAAFNCLLMQVKTVQYNEFVLERELRDACRRLSETDISRPGADPLASVLGTRGGDAAALRAAAEATADEGLSLGHGYLEQWYAPRAAAELLFWAGLVEDYEHADVMRVVLARAARSARRTTHFDLDFPRTPQLEPYWCHKHRRECRPVERAEHFLRRYALDTLARIKAFSRVREKRATADILHADSRTVDWDGPFDGVITSPPYPGLIDYHEQHRYAYELLGLDDRRELELGAAASGTSRAALAAYSDGIAAALANGASVLRRGSPVVIVVNDRRNLYPTILEQAGLTLVDRYCRHVNRRTGRRAGEFFEDVLVARA